MLTVERRFGRPIEDILREMYISKQMPTTEISKELDISTAAVKVWCTRFGISMRSISESKIIQYSKMPLSIRRKHTRKANVEFRRMRDNGTLVFNRPWMKTEDNPAKQPEARRINSEHKRNHNPMKIERHAMKMRKSMEGYLRSRATTHEIVFKNAIERLGYFPKFQHAEYRAVFDFAFVDYQIGIELDGFSHMTFPTVREKDKRRDAELERRGWIILRFFNSEIEDYLGECLREVIEVVEANRPLYQYREVSGNANGG